MSGKFDFYLSIAHDKGLCALVKRCKPDINTQPLFYSLRDNEIYLDIGNEEKIDNTFEIVCQWMDKLLIPKMNELCASE